MYRLQKSGKDPLLIYDTGLSIGALKERYNLLMNISEQLTARYHIHHNSGEMPIHREIMDVTGHPQWILLPGVLGGILPGSKSKKFDQKILYMFIHYMGYRAGNAREMATVAMVGTLCGRHMFPCHTDEQTCGICITKVERSRSSIRNQRLIIAGDRERANVFACYFGPTNFRVAQEGLFGIYDCKQGDVRASIYNFTLIKYLCGYIKLIIFWIGEWWEEFVELWQ